MNKNCLSFWHPLLVAAGVRTPRTEIVRTDLNLMACCFSEPRDPEPDIAGYLSFLAQLAAAADRMGYPCFLRTGQTSGKHSWSRCCYVTGREKIGQHVAALVGFSEMADFMGLPTDVWCVREMLPTMPIGVCEGYGGMPVCKEFRFFVDGDKVECFHPYWPLSSLDEGGFAADVRPSWYEDLCTLPADTNLAKLASQAGAALGGRWSVDLLETRNGCWYVTDCAEADRSFHWSDCPNCPPEQRRAEIPIDQGWFDKMIDDLPDAEHSPAVLRRPLNHEGER